MCFVPLTVVVPSTLADFCLYDDNVMHFVPLAVVAGQPSVLSSLLVRRSCNVYFVENFVNLTHQVYDRLYCTCSTM